jgi:hypothetical protein
MYRPSRETIALVRELARPDYLRLNHSLLHLSLDRVIEEEPDLARRQYAIDQITAALHHGHRLRQQSEPPAVIETTGRIIETEGQIQP